MSEVQGTVEKRIHLSADRAKQLDHFAHVRQVSEDQIFERALDILFALTDLLGEGKDEPSLDWLNAQSQSAAYQEWLSDDNSIYDELFSDVDPKR